LNIFLKRNGFKTVVLNEKASICPIDKKTHPYFNIWTLVRAVADILEYSQNGINKTDIILIDRGIFDALCWFEWLITNPTKENPHLDIENFNCLKPFITMKMFTSSLDLVYVFTAEPTTALQREYAALLTERYGTIMEPTVLESYNIAINAAVNKYRSEFLKIEEFDTTGIEPDKVSYNVTLSILNILKDMVIEKIGYINSTLNSKLKKGVNNVAILNEYEIKFEDRETVENSDYIQPIPIAVITNKERNRVLVVKKHPLKTGYGSAETNRYLLYFGGHIRQEDKRGNSFKIFHEK
jgi:hypothetical protein